MSTSTSVFEGVESMNIWQENQLADKIIQILKDVPDTNSQHHMGYPFLSAYQIAIEFAARYPEIVAETGYQVGGVGIGERTSLAQYLARQLSSHIRDGNLPEVEGGFLSNWHLQDILLDNQGETIQSSLTGTQFTLSMFRYKP
jgi:hypothetical protein